MDQISPPRRPRLGGRNRTRANFNRYKLLKKLLGPTFFAVYFGTGIVYLLLLLAFGHIKSFGPFALVLGLLTGSDPFNFKSDLEGNWFLWVGAWLIHTASWLIIPSLVGVVIPGILKRARREQLAYIEMIVGTILRHSNTLNDQDKEIAGQEIRDELKKQMEELL